MMRVVVQCKTPDPTRIIHLGPNINEWRVEAWQVNGYIVALWWQPIAAGHIKVFEPDRDEPLIRWAIGPRPGMQGEEDFYKLLNTAIQLCLTNGIRHAPERPNMKRKMDAKHWYDYPEFVDFIESHHYPHFGPSTMDTSDWTENFDAIVQRDREMHYIHDSRNGREFDNMLKHEAKKIKKQYPLKRTKK